MSISKVVKHAIRTLPGVQTAVFRTRKTARDDAEFVTIALTSVKENLVTRHEIRRIVQTAYDWSAQITSGGMQNFTMRLNSDW